MVEDVRSALTRAELRADGGGVTAHFRFTSEQVVFAGHFPNRPLVPAVFQVQMVLSALAAVGWGECQLQRIGKAKFTRPIAPGDDVQVVVDPVKDTGRVRARLSVSGEPAAQLSLQVRWNAQDRQGS